MLRPHAICVACSAQKVHWAPNPKKNKKKQATTTNVKSYMGASIICRTLEFSPQNGDESEGMGAKKKKNSSIWCPSNCHKVCLLIEIKKGPFLSVPSMEWNMDGCGHGLRINEDKPNGRQGCSIEHKLSYERTLGEKCKQTVAVVRGGMTFYSYSCLD